MKTEPINLKRCSQVIKLLIQLNSESVLSNNKSLAALLAASPIELSVSFILKMYLAFILISSAGPLAALGALCPWFADAQPPRLRLRWPASRPLPALPVVFAQITDYTIFAFRCPCCADVTSV